MKFKKLVESIRSENKMTIRVASGLNADGCDIIITDAEGNILHKEEYRYGYNASHSKKWAEWYPEKPHMKDIIDELCTNYGIVKSDIVFKCGANVFSGTDITDAAVAEFKNNYVESLTETYWIDSKEVMDEVDRLGNELEADGFKYYGDRYSGSTYYNFFTKRGDNRAICKAIQYNYDGAQTIDVTVDQMMGYEPIDRFEKMRRDLGKALLPHNESFEMAVGGDDFDGEIAAMRAEQKEYDARRAARKERFALMHKLFDAHMDAEPDANWVDKVYHIFDTAESTTFIGNKYGTIPGRTEDKQPIRYRFSIKEYDFYTDPYWEIVYIGTNNVDPLKEDLEDDFDLYMKASDFKCKLSRYDVEEAANPDELITYMEDVYSILSDEYGAENIKWWKFYEDDDVDFGYKVCLKDGSKHIVEINNDRVDEINEAVNPADLTDCPECGGPVFDSRRGVCTKCSYRESLTESATVKHLYYAPDLNGLKRGWWLDVKEENGRTYAKWSFSDEWSDITDRIEERPHHHIVGNTQSKTFTFGGWRFWMDDEVEKFWEREGHRIRGNFEIPGMPNVRRDNESKSIKEDSSCLTRYVICGVTNEGTRMLYDAVNDNFTTDYDAATKYDDMDVARDDWFKIPRNEFRRIFIPIYDPAIFECVTETFDADKVQKRIACTTEFDNGHVFHNDYFRASSAEAEERAKQTSIENPDKVFYVKYDDVMNPCSDIKWKNGEQLNENNLVFVDNKKNAILSNDASMDPGFDEYDVDDTDVYFDFDNEVDRLDEKVEPGATGTTRRERFGIFYDLFDYYMAADENNPKKRGWIDDLLGLIRDCKSVTFVGEQYGAIPKRTEDNQPIKCIYSIKGYDFYADPDREVVYIAAGDLEPIVFEDPKVDFNNLHELVREELENLLDQAFDNLASHMDNFIDDYNPEWCQVEGYGPNHERLMKTRLAFLNAVEAMLFANAPVNENL